MNSYGSLSDNELVDLLKEDQQQALSALYFRYWDKLLSVAGNRLDNPEIAEECVQDVFFSLWQRRNDLKLKYSLATYLAVAVKYQVIKQLDKQYRLQDRKDKSLYASQEVFHPSADEHLLEKELMDRIEVAVNRLPEKCRIVFKLSREHGMTNKQIAADLDISEKTVEAHLSKAIKDLRNDLSAISPLILLWFFGNNY
ncbi:RNA polymerase sigma-70 factor [Pedobacter sp.]|jgi:RNA polymerase sigma-70 factor (family 1)|uniref:RNA polymerase sigma-70 factor n=1 Tax=Pedobacter sp. TaxID=1411316 RepID=UPI002CFACDCF|nr:RNA polymerase sigma-70 factor [Pedobacter sp.]HWW38177.1 RNA polymerase sigma-70 factor [Pedobacter sp.]